MNTPSFFGGYWGSSIQKLLVSFLTLMGLLLTGRIYFFLDFAPTGFWEETTWLEIVLVFLSATRFDMSLASVVIFFPVIGTLFLVPFSKRTGEIWEIICKWYIRVFLYVTVLFSIVSHYFFLLLP